jgi:hypothetical protein
VVTTHPRIAHTAIFYANRYAPLIHQQRTDVPAILVPGVKHVGMTTDPRALAAITSAMK